MASEITHLNRLMVVSQDNERRRIARDIHDGPLQSMGVELLAVDRIRRHLNAADYDRASQELNYLRTVASETVQDLRCTVNTLRNTLLDHDLKLALQNLARKVGEATGLEISLIYRPGHHLPRSFETCVYQLAVEALNNAQKHARAEKVLITVSESDGELLVSIKDDGQGFSYDSSLRRAIETGHIGLHSMKERAAEFDGTMAVLSSPGTGTEILFSFPVESVVSPVAAAS